MSGSVVESRGNYGGGYGTAISDAPASKGGGEGISSNKMRSYMIIAILVAGVELVLIGILLFMVFGGEEKVCTYEDVMETIEKDPSPSENWKIYESFMIHDPEKALRVYANISGDTVTEENYNSLIGWAEEYVEKFGGEAPGDDVEILAAEAMMDEDDNSGAYWGIFLTTKDSCMRFDFSTNFLFLEKYSLTAGNCDEFDS